MGIINRYRFVKRMNPKSIILIKGKKGYISFEKDFQILKYIKFNFDYNSCNLHYFDKFEINYIVLDNLDVIEEEKYINNNYNKYLKLSYLCDILMVINR